jgi:hypothetical protein
LISLCQHLLQYTGGLAETQGLLLPSFYIVTLSNATLNTDKNISSFQNFIRDYCSSERSFL